MPTSIDFIKPYSQWVLVGFFLGYKLVPHPQNKRLSYFVSPYGEARTDLIVQMSAVNTLFSSGFLDFNEQTKVYKLSVKGFNRAHDRVKQALGIIPSENFVG